MEWKKENLLSVREHVYRYLKESILEGKYKPGERLNELELSEKLNISRTPIREALFSLASQGFVKNIPRKGIVVSKISEQDIFEVFTILSSLEVLASKLAAQNMTEETQKKFDQLIEKLVKIEGQSDDDIESKQIEMYLLLYKATKNEKLIQILSGLINYIHMSATVGNETPGRRKESVHEHIKIMKAVRNKEVELVENLMRIHIENSRRAYVNSMEKRKEKVVK
jgi:DNA-binding GntR family transcriptional regulator